MEDFVQLTIVRFQTHGAQFHESQDYLIETVQKQDVIQRQDNRNFRTVLSPDAQKINVLSKCYLGVGMRGRLFSEDVVQAAVAAGVGS
jgi:hypothetical protein